MPLGVHSVFLEEVRMAVGGKTARVASDIGGTFTDIALEIGDQVYSTKVLTNHAEPEQSVLEGLAQVFERVSIEWPNIDSFVHGTTLVTNALIERKGAYTAFLTNKGFRDTIEMRTESRFEQYDLNIVLPRPLIEREDRFVVEGRLSATGEELLPLDDDGVRCFAETIAVKGYRSVAVGFLHSYANAAHERRAGEIIRKFAPDVSISLSSDVSAQMREFERFNTVCANAYVKPLVGSYLSRLLSGAKRRGLNAPLFLIHSGGGLVSVETAMEVPVRLLESGPAGGAIFAGYIAKRHNRSNALSFDMGGTTAKICIIQDYRPQMTRTFEVARSSRFKKGSGMQISVPAVEMIEIGAGGGSIAHIDSMRQIRIGPESAGSDPGPACYQRGGKQPTVTDADLVLGRLDAKYFAGGTIELSIADSTIALVTHIAEPMGCNVLDAAASVCELVDENMVNAARAHAAESGRELTEYTMIAFGGAAPLHAARLCEKLGVTELLVPPGAGVGSAIGFLRAPFGYEAVRGTYHALSSFDHGQANRILVELREEAEDIVQRCRPVESLQYAVRAFMRYRGQGWEIPVCLSKQRFVAEDVADIRASFEQEYCKLFGRLLPDVDIEILGWSLHVASQEEWPRTAAAMRNKKSPTSTVVRDIHDARLGTRVSAAVFRRDCITPGDVISGPAIIAEDETATLVTSTFEATVLSDGCLLLRRKHAEAR